MWIGAEIGSIVAFILGRYVFRSVVQSKANKYKIFGAIDKAI